MISESFASGQLRARGRVPKRKAPPGDGAKGWKGGVACKKPHPRQGRGPTRPNWGGVYLSRAWLALRRSRSCSAPARLPSALTAGRSPFLHVGRPLLTPRGTTRMRGFPPALVPQTVRPVPVDGRRRENLMK